MITNQQKQNSKSVTSSKKTKWTETIIGVTKANQLIYRRKKFANSQESLLNQSIYQQNKQYIYLYTQYLFIACFDNSSLLDSISFAPIDKISILIIIIVIMKNILIIRFENQFQMQKKEIKIRINKQINQLINSYYLSSIDFSFSSHFNIGSFKKTTISIS
ncbi:hypothetical protein ABPG74_017876 [Tetrahymena malaccensis]